MNQSNDLESTAQRTAYVLDCIASWLDTESVERAGFTLNNGQIAAIRQWALDARQDLLDTLDVQNARDYTAITHALELGASTIAEDW